MKQSNLFTNAIISYWSFSNSFYFIPHFANCEQYEVHVHVSL